MFLIQNLVLYYKQKTKLASQHSNTPQCRRLKVDTFSDEYFNNQMSLRSISLWQEHPVSSNNFHVKQFKLNEKTFNTKILQSKIQNVDTIEPTLFINHGHEKDTCCSPCKTNDTNKNVDVLNVWSDIDKETPWNEISSNECKDPLASRGLLGNLKESVRINESLSSSCVSQDSYETSPLSETFLKHVETKIYEEPVVVQPVVKHSEKKLDHSYEDLNHLTDFNCSKNKCTSQFENSPCQTRTTLKRSLEKRCFHHHNHNNNVTNAIRNMCETDEANEYNNFVGFPMITCCITGRYLVHPDVQLPLPTLDIGDVLVEYFNVNRFLGRGGKIRLFLCMKQIKHSYHAYNLNSYHLIEKRQYELIQTGLSPTGHFPTLIHNGKTFCETHVILRYLAKHINEYGSRMENEDYFADMLMEKLGYWTNDLMAAIKEVLHSCCRQNILIYLKRRFGYYKLMDVLLFKIRSMWITTTDQERNSTNSCNEWICTWYDAAVAATLFDDMQLMAFIYETNQLCPLLYKIKQHVPTYNRKIILQHFLLDYQGKDAAKHKFPMLFQYFLNVTNSPHVLQLMCECQMARRMYGIHLESNPQCLVS